MAHATALTKRPVVPIAHGDDLTNPVIRVPSPWLSRLTVLAGGIVLTLGIVVMFGWHAGNLAVIRVLPTAVPMYYNTALSFVLTGIGLLAMASGWSRLARVTGGIVATIGTFTLSEYLFGVDIGIDQALMTDWVHFGSVAPGRMALATAVGFTLNGVSLLDMSDSMIQRSARRMVLAGVAGTVVVTLGLITVGLYLSNLMTAEGWGHIAHAMAVHTAIGLMLGGAGLLSWVWQAQEQPQGSLPPWLPMGAGASVMTATLLLWQALLVQQQDFPIAARTALPTVLLQGGLLLAVFVTLIVFLAQRAWRQELETRAVNHALQQEIAARKAIEVAFRASEERFQLFMDYNPAIAWMKDEEGRHVYHNQAYERRFGVRLADWRGKTDFDLWSAEVAEVFRKNDLAVLAGGRPLEVTENTLSPDGASCTWWNFKFPFQDASGKKYVAGIGIDITARVQAEMALRTLNADLDRRVQERTADLARATADLRQIAYISAHDLQEPVRQIGLYTQLVATRSRDTLDAETQEAVAFIVDGTKRMQAQFTDLMHYLEVDEHPDTIVRTDCEVLLQQAIAVLRDPISTSDATITHDPLPTPAVSPTQLQLVLQELLGNALKFRDSMPLRVHVWAEREEGGWRFAVRDNGIGIEPQSVDQLFRFFRKLQQRTDYPGTGMGLAICKKIVERHGGRIWVESEPGKGTTVYFTISGKSSQ